MGLQALENKVLLRGIIGKSAPILAEITIRKSQEKKVSEARRIRSGLKLGLGKQANGWKSLELLSKEHFVIGGYACLSPCWCMSGSVTMHAEGRASLHV